MYIVYVYIYNMYAYCIYMREFYSCVCLTGGYTFGILLKQREFLDFVTEQRSICPKNDLDRAREICKKTRFDDQVRLDAKTYF